MDTKFEQEFEGAMDISYNEDRTIMSFHHEKTEHGGVVTRIAMYDYDNKPAPMHRATHGLLVELDENFNIVHQRNVTIRWDGDEPYMNLPSKKKLLS